MHTLQEMLYPTVVRVTRSLRSIPSWVSLVSGIYGRRAYLLRILTSRARVVRSMAFMLTLFLGVMGEFASLRGLKFNTLFRILLAAMGRRWIKTPKLLSTDVTNNASLYPVRYVPPLNAMLSDL